MGDMRETTLEKKIEIMSNIGLLQSDSGFFMALVNVYNIGFPLAWLSHLDYVSDLADKGVEQIENTWLVLLKLLQVEDIGYESLTQLLEVSTRYQNWLEEGFDIDENEVH